MRLSFDLAGCVRLDVVGVDEASARSIRDQMDPYGPQGSGAGDAEVVLEAEPRRPDRRFADVQNPAGDVVVTAADGTSLYLLRGGLACRLSEGPPFRFTYERGFPISVLFGAVLRPALQLGALERGAVAIHAASVDLAGGIVVGGWSETGKTETALALAEQGAAFVSDKWTFLRPDGTIAAFPISVGVRRWVLRYLPRLAGSLPRSARIQFRMARVASAFQAPFRGLERAERPIGRAAGTLLANAVALADRAALKPDEIRAAYDRGGGDNVTATLRAIVLLTTVPGKPSAAGGVSVERADASWAARRFARSAAYERRPFLDLEARLRYAFPSREARLGPDIERREEEILRNALARTTILEVRAPFPVDPRRVAAAVLEAL